MKQIDKLMTLADTNRQQDHQEYKDIPKKTRDIIAITIRMVGLEKAMAIYPENQIWLVYYYHPKLRDVYLCKLLLRDGTIIPIPDLKQGACLTKKV